MPDQKASTTEETKPTSLPQQLQKKPIALPQEISYESLVSYLNKNIHSVQLGIYSIALFGIVIAARSVRPFKKFKHPREIPKSFFNKHVQLNGTVMRVDFNPKPVLVVDHHPLLLSNLRRPGIGLKVGVEGIDLMPNGVSWLQTILVGQNIKFTLISPQNEYVSSIIEYNKKDVANQLLSIGFASVSTYNEKLDSDKIYPKYYKSLLKLESKAESGRVGMWSDASFNLIKFILTKLYSNINRLKPKSLKLN